ncbi:hypothetical protein BDF19DRAFT_446009 [Syncephalis fuscata]|nr:hypothetical protein BDF19DRAFT_446009 [Syncephalis fuscata]
MISTTLLIVLSLCITCYLQLFISLYSNCITVYILTCRLSHSYFLVVISIFD